MPIVGAQEMGIDAGKKQKSLGNCPRCGDPLESAHGVVRCTRWGCNFIEGLREFIEGKHIAQAEEESSVERNLANITQEEKEREKKFRATRRTGLLARLGFRK